MPENSNKILVAVDGTQKAFKTIQYLCSFKPFLEKELVLHNITTNVPECFYDLEEEPFSSMEISRVGKWKSGYITQINVFMAKAKAMLIDSGFRPDAISCIVAERNKGIARDIMDEAQKGYEALLIRRRGGVQVLVSLAMGSVSTKLVKNTVSLPVMLAGTQEVNHHVFLAIDGSKGAKRAVDFVAKTVGDSDCRIVLCSVLRDFDIYNDKKKKKSAGFIKKAFREIETAIWEAGKIFENAGIEKKNIIKKIIQGAQSRAGSIVEAAKEEGCDTIVFGRKGKSDVRDFDIGRVPWKVIHGAREMTVWMVP